MTRSRTRRSSRLLAIAAVVVAVLVAVLVGVTALAFTPARPGATHYRSAAVAADRGPSPADPLREAIMRGVRAGLRRKGLPAPDEDARLDAATTDLARGLKAEDLPASDAVAFLLAHYGIIEPSPRWLIERATPGNDREAGERIAADVVGELGAAPAARIGLGIARADSALSVVIALQEKNLEIEPVARRLAPGRAAMVAGQLTGHYRDPQLVVTAPGGGVHEVATLRAGPGTGFRGQVRCAEGPAGQGRYQVEITGVDEGGRKVLANFPIYCGVAPPLDAPGPAGARGVSLTAPEAEKRILFLLNRDRAAAGLPALALDGRLSAVARAHSRDMAEHDFVAHVSPTTGTFVQRVARAGLNPRLLMENVGRDYSAEGAQGGFMASPGHRGNILDRHTTRVGIGVVIGKEVSGAAPLFVTQLMM